MTNQSEAMSIQPPAWMLAAARNAVKVSGVNPDEAFAARIRDVRKQAEACSKQHQETKSLLAKKLEELSPKSVLKSSDRFEQANVREESSSTERQLVKTSAAGTVAGSKAIIRTSDSSKRKEAVKTPEKKQSKKVRFLTEQVEKDSSLKDTARQPQKTASTTAGNDSNPNETVPALSKSLPSSQYKVEEYNVPLDLPEWYTSISIDNRHMKHLSKRRPPALTALDALKDLARQCEEAPKKNRSGDLPNLYNKLRDLIHKAEIILPVTHHILRKAHMLSPQTGLPRIFRAQANFPPDIKADSYQLYKRWYAGNLTQDLLRGIITKKSTNRSSDSICPIYRTKYPVTAKYIGQGDLVPGQWWPTQLCAVRDGAHGTPQGGIFGSKSHGAYSIVLSSGTGYADHDAGDTIYYSGTENSDNTGSVTENTKHLLTSLQTRDPVRVLRSAQLGKANKYRPERGIRYDGLYVVVGHEVLDEKKGVLRFRLERCDGQEGIRWEGEARRPTVYEVREYERLKEEGAWMGGVC
ncbi:PUA-like domain-containing protein [Bipolaris maydis]|nr:PUA-like domain-containing protein [Bipolaris maydis]